MFGLNGQQVVQRARALAADHATRRGLPADASDAVLETAIGAVRDLVSRDRKLRRPLRHTRVRAVVESLVAWEVVVAAVGTDGAEARWFELRGRVRTSGQPLAASIRRAILAAGPAVPAEPARIVQGRPRRLPDARVHPGLAGIVHTAASDDDDSMHEDGYEHDLWLDEWLELTVGTEAMNGLEAAVTAHPLVDIAYHEDREVFYVAAPTLHPEDVRQIVLGVLADAYDPNWQQRA